MGQAVIQVGLLKGLCSVQDESAGKVSAIDINKGRLRILKETAKSHQLIDVINTIHSDLREYARADLRWNRRVEDMEELKHLQDELVDSAATLVKPGGVLTYSTCSIDPEENEERVVAFLLRNLEFKVDSVEKYVPESFVTEKGFYFSSPIKHLLDGAFGARLIRIK